MVISEIDLNKFMGKKITVQTINSTYILSKTKNFSENFMITGGTRFSEPTLVRINGCTWGGSMLKMNMIILGMHLELFRIEEQKLLVTTKIKNITVEL